MLLAIQWTCINTTSSGCFATDVMVTPRSLRW